MEIIINNVKFTYHQKNDFIIQVEKVVFQEGTFTLTNIEVKHIDKQLNKSINSEITSSNGIENNDTNATPVENEEGKKVMEIATATIDVEKKIFHFPNVDTQISKECYDDLLLLFNHFMSYSRQIEYSEIRPMTPVMNDPKKWWKFASQVVQLQFILQLLN